MKLWPLPRRLLREQWIRARYERNEFIYVERQEPYSAGYREGFLWKRGRDNGQFLSRKFILSEREGALKYFNKHDAREPKALMKIHTINATFQPAKIGNPHGLQITYLKDNSTRNIFVYHEDGKPMISRDFILISVCVCLSQDAYARGEVFIGSKENGYTVVPGLPPSTQGYHWQFGITIVTPDRKFLFACETEEEQKEWIAMFQSAVNRPMLPQEYAEFIHKEHMI
uniref:ArfGAP with dual PH domains 1 n=1 Tax=Astyanax mexicanus TaxID=7994 RepID=A0A8B9KTI4_ASTMX